MSLKYFYDRQDGVCKQFMYTGCGGNENRFESKQECEQQCFEAQGNYNLMFEYNILKNKILKCCNHIISFRHM